MGGGCRLILGDDTDMSRSLTASLVDLVDFRSWVAWLEPVLLRIHDQLARRNLYNTSSVTALLRTFASVSIHLPADLDFVP